MINKAQKSPKKFTWNSVFPTQFVKNTLIPDLSFIICIVSEKSKFINHLVCITLVLLLALLCSIHGANFFFKASPRGSAGTFREWKNDQYAASREPFSIEWSKPECALFGELMIALDQELFAH